MRRRRASSTVCREPSANRTSAVVFEGRLLTSNIANCSSTLTTSGLPKPLAELVRLREEIAEAKRQNAAVPDTHDYSEAGTRDYFIDLLLKEAGGPLDAARDREYEVSGMPNEKGLGFVDYVLWGETACPSR